MHRALGNWQAANASNIYGEVFTEQGVVLWTKQPVVDWLGTYYSVMNDDWYFATVSSNLCANPWLWDDGARAEKVWVSDRVYTHLKLVWG